MLHLMIPAGIDLAEARHRERQARETALRPVRRKAAHPLRRLRTWAAERAPRPSPEPSARRAGERTVIPIPRPSHAER